MEVAFMALAAELGNLADLLLMSCCAIVGS
jgi:hypothetical protein